MTKRSWMVILCGLALGLATSVRAQNSNSGDIRGTVTDPSGGVIPGVTVTVTNSDTGVINKFVTNNDGLYDTNSILPGSYTLQFSKGGFGTLKQGPIKLEVGIITVDGTLKVGAATEVVEVSSSEEALLKTEDAQVATTISLNQLAGLPSVDPANGWTSLLKLLPGATSTPGGGANGGGGGDQNPGVDQAIGGTMPYFSSFLVDGGSIWLPHSANIDQGLSEVVSEVNIIATNAPAQYGGGGTVFNVISKSGANRWHGAAYENFQNDDLNARDYFNAGAKAKQRFNYFGGSVSGPVLKNKLFFYYNYQALKNPNSSISTSSQPTAAMKAGCFNPALFGTNLTLDAAHGGKPLTTNATQCAAFEPATDLAIPTADFDPVAVQIQKYYLTPNAPGLSSNYQYLKPGNGNQVKNFGRLDYNISDKNRLYLSVTERAAPHRVNYDPGPNCPINCENYANEGYNSQISDVNTFTSSLVNEFRQSFVRQGNWYVPQSLGQGLPAKLGLQFSKADVFPGVGVGGTGGPSGLGAGTNAIFIQNTFVTADSLTLIKGKHILHFGGEIMFAQDNSTPWGSINGASLNFSGQYTTNNPLVNVGYADFLLGDVQGWNTSVTPSHEMRQQNPSFYAQDDIKLRPNLTINIGVRSETHGGMKETKNRMGGFDPTLANPVPSTTQYPTNPLGSLWFASASGARNEAFQTKTIVMPRFGFAWEPTDKWVVRGGVGQYSSLWSMDTAGGPVGFGSGLTGSQTANVGQAPVVQLSGSGANLAVLGGINPVSYITPATPQGSGNIPYTPYSLPIMNGWQWTAGVQRRLPQNMVVEVQYVGSHWQNQMFEADINSLPKTKLGGGQTARPYPQFSGIGIGSGGARTGLYTGISNYHAAEFMLHRPSSHGLSFEAAYTWSRLYDDMDSSGWGNQFGAVYYQDAFTPSDNYGPSNFNRADTIKGTVLYVLPFGKGHQYLQSGLADAVVGGWEASAAVVADSGAPFTVVMNSSTSTGSLGAEDGNGAAALYPNLVGNPGTGGRTLKQWFNQLAYATPAALTYGNNKRNSLIGPRVNDTDFSLAKSWGLPGWESGKINLRIDAINLFNHPSFQNPSASLNPTALASKTADPSVGKISNTTITGRVVQLSGRFSF